MFVAVLRFELSLPSATSLKDKRRVIKSLIERVRAKFGVAAAEVGDQELWQRSEVGMALVSGAEAHVREAAGKVVAFVDSHFEGEVCRCDLEII